MGFQFVKLIEFESGHAPNPLVFHSHNLVTRDIAFLVVNRVLLIDVLKHDNKYARDYDQNAYNNRNNFDPHEHGKLLCTWIQRSFKSVKLFVEENPGIIFLWR